MHFLIEKCSPSTAGIKPKNKESKAKERWHQVMIQTAYDFAENNTPNGLKYITHNGVSILEKLFWIFMFILSTILCVIMTYKSYVKYDTSGVVVTLKERLVSVNEYPFPAVTICSQARIKQNIYNYSDKAISFIKDPFQHGKSAELQKFHSALILCNSEEELRHNYTFLNHDVDIATFFELAPKHEDIFKNCSWRNKYNCVRKFRPVLTADGVCYTFNNLASDEIFRINSMDYKHRRYYLNTSTPQKGWSLERNYYSSENDTFPRRGRANGAREDLYIVLKEAFDRDVACDDHTRPGYKVYLHHPADLPQASLHSYAAQPGRTTSIAVKLDILDTAEELADYAPVIRQCYFPSERYLQFFQKYTSSNCQLECLTNYTVQSCGCVSFYMPHNKSTAVCKGDRWKCIQTALDQYADEEDLSNGEVSRCSCLPSCTDVNYDADVVLTKLDLREYYKRLEKLTKHIDVIKGRSQYRYKTQTVNTDKKYDHSDSDNTKENHNDTMITQIRIYYRRPRFVAMERSELVGLSQFLADVGGTLGLFLGFSFLTLAEIFYFFTFKLCCTFQRANSTNEKKSSVDSDL